MPEPVQRLGRSSLRYAAYALLIAAVAGGSWRFAWHDGLDGLAARGRADLAWAADRLTAQLFRGRELAVILARHPLLADALETGTTPPREAELLRAMADLTGADRITLVDREGRVRAASGPPPPGWRAEALPLARALSGALGTTHVVTPGGAAAAPRRVFAFAAPVFGPGGQVAGAVAVEDDVRGIEENWPGNAPAVYFTGADGRVIVSDRSDLVLANPATGAGFPALRETWVGEHRLWRIEAGPYLPARALYLARALPTVGVTAAILEDTRPTARAALLLAALASTLTLIFVAVVELILRSRRVLALRLRAESDMTHRLEARVRDRTRALSEANAALRREVAERIEADAALTRAQDELVQASRLAALGKMSAGISHELNQPLMAIGSFAENGAAFLDRGRPEAARANLDRIADLARRMGRIIHNLRAFARQESGPIGAVDLAAVVATALETLAGRIVGANVALDWTPPPMPILVRGGEVRLGQVVVNLLSNALDAVEDVDEKRIRLRLDDAGDRVRLSVADSGKGIAEPERVFDPFYTTKKIGAAEGMGLGLSISYGLVRDFSGSIRAENAAKGGAVFTLDLIKAGEGAG